MLHLGVRDFFAVFAIFTRSRLLSLLQAFREKASLAFSHRTSPLLFRTLSVRTAPQLTESITPGRGYL